MYARIVHAYRNSSLRAKMTLLVSISLLTVMLFSQGFIYRHIVSLVNQRARQTAQTTIIQLESSITDRLRGLVERLYYIRYDTSFDTTLSNYLFSDTPDSYSVATSQLPAFLSLHRATESLVDSLYLYTSKGSFTDLGPLTVQSYQFEHSTLWEQMTANGVPITWGQIYTDEIFVTHRQVIPLLYRFRIDGWGEDCVLLANINRTNLTREVTSLLSDTSSALFLVDEHGQILTETTGAAALLTNQPEMLSAVLGSGSDFTQLELNGDLYLAAQFPLSLSPWRMVYLQSESDFFTLLSRIGFVFVLVNLLALAIVLAAVLRIIRSVTAPLSRLSDCMHADVPAPFDYPYQNEIGKLARSYNSLLAHNSNLLQEQVSYIEQLQFEKEQLRVEQQLKRRAELKALQAQINPHFLYNTLDSIHWKAEIADQPEISQMTLALATLFRVGLSRGHEIIPLEQELRHVDSYLQIQKLRYGDRLNYKMDVPAQLFPLHTVKLILQPLVENAIYHGIKENDKPGTITITGQMNGTTLELVVTDDGLGIPQPRLEILQADLKRGLSVSNDGYGIYNVNERIRLYFGAEYGLTLESTFGKGTVATVRLPCIDEKEAERYVSLTDR